MSELSQSNDEILALLIEKQTHKIIESYNKQDCYFSIRQNFDLEQFLWIIATQIYSSIGEKIDFIKTKKIIKQYQASAYSLHALEEKNKRQEQKRIGLEKIQKRKDIIYGEIELLESQLGQILDQNILDKSINKSTQEKNILLKIIKFKEELQNLFVTQREMILSEIKQAEIDYDFVLIAKLKFQDLVFLEEKIEKISNELLQLSTQINSKVQEEEMAEEKKKSYFLEIIKQVENTLGKEDILIEILELIESQLEIDYQLMKVDSSISNDLRADELDTIELSMEIEELVHVEIPNELLGSYRVGGLSDGTSYPISCSIRELLEFISSKLNTL
ncbi:hypothetical protein [Synechocystis sp. LKSZ1]|uniref:hypothetical protein n=1 Tax=Synechocystis sp. LKSZ1 TaxID=3144951 RepID=UPI00336BBF31